MAFYNSTLFLMDIVRAGFIYFRNGDSLKIVAVALFNGGQCLQFLYDQNMLERFLIESGELNQVPEYLNEAIAGCSENMWNNFYTQISKNGFLHFSETADYDPESFRVKSEEMIPYIQKIIENDRENTV